MAGEATIQFVGNLTADPELRFTPSGAAVASFSVAVTPRTKQGDEWTDGDATFYRCSVWRTMAENVTESLTKGTRVIVSGRHKVRRYEKDGVQRESNEVEVDSIGPDLRFASAKTVRTERGSNPANDPWSTPAARTDDAPPF